MSVAAALARLFRLSAALLCLAVVGRVGWVAYGPSSEQPRVATAVAFLGHAVDTGAADRMQGLFPEGSYFLRALTASAAAGSHSLDPATVRALRDGLDAPDSVAVFGSGMVPEHGIFQAGWALMAAVDLATATGNAADREDLRHRAELVDGALRASRTGFLEGYPGQFWPCDSVVAAASLARASALLDRPDWSATVRSWRTLVSRAVDPATGLLPHRVDADGQPLEGPRGSSASIIQAFWPEIGRVLDGRVDTSIWLAFRSTFVVREAGLVGVREFPRGVRGSGDVDSGPLLFGVSGSASVVALAAARQVGDQTLADTLDREAELLGFPTAWRGERRYAFGVLPVGDAFLAWARSRPAAAAAADLPSGPRPLWPVPLVLCTALLGLLVIVEVRRRRPAARTVGVGPVCRP